MNHLLRQATKSALALLGGASFLRGNVPCRVCIEHGVQLTGFDNAGAGTSYTDGDYMVVEKDVATIDAQHSPRVGDTLKHPDGDYVLDALLEDKGVFRRFVLRKA